MAEKYIFFCTSLPVREIFQKHHKSHSAYLGYKRYVSLGSVYNKEIKSDNSWPSLFNVAASVTQIRSEYRRLWVIFGFHMCYFTSRIRKPFGTLQQCNMVDAYVRLKKVTAGGRTFAWKVWTFGYTFLFHVHVAPTFVYRMTRHETNKYSVSVLSLRFNFSRPDNKVFKNLFHIEFSIASRS
jgi:hypothetical protein